MSSFYMDGELPDPSFVAKKEAERLQFEINERKRWDEIDRKRLISNKSLKPQLVKIYSDNAQETHIPVLKIDTNMSKIAHNFVESVRKISQ